ncbi:MAG: JAB-like toxin 1 domain-containing protein [Rikenellaceae bacterium]
MFWNKKNKNDDSENQNYEYKFRRNGSIIQKPTDSDYSYAKIKSNPALKGLKGVDDYSEFTSKDKKNNLIYKFNDSSNITDFNFSDNPNKEKRAAKRAEKGRNRRGTAFTINDDKVADELYRAVAGNSDVEYMKVGYRQNEDSEEQNLIKTDKSPTMVKPKDLGALHVAGKEIIDVTHSHPFNPNGIFATKFASEEDTLDYLNTYNNFHTDYKVSNRNYNMPKHNVYHPWTSDINNLPHTMEYNHKGTILLNEMTLDDTKEMYYKKLKEEAGIEIKR